MTVRELILILLDHEALDPKDMDREVIVKGAFTGSVHEVINVHRENKELVISIGG